jgi:hypothetical protein
MVVVVILRAVPQLDMKATDNATVRIRENFDGFMMDEV